MNNYMYSGDYSRKFIQYYIDDVEELAPFLEEILKRNYFNKDNLSLLDVGCGDG